MTTLDRSTRAPAAHAPARATRAARAPRQEIGALSYYLVAGAALLLVAIGVVMVLSASTITSIRETGNPYAAFLGQLRFVLIGLPLAVLASRIPVVWYRRLAWPAFLATLGAQLLIFTPLARSQGGNVNWIYLPGLGQTVQPSEFLKLGLALWLGLVLARKGRLLATDWKHALLPGVLGAGAAIALVLAGHDLGTVLVMVALVAGAYFVAGLPLRWYGAAGVLGAGAAAFMVVISPSRTTRVLTFLGLVESDPTGSGFQTQHGLWGLGTGGISGVGLGASREKWSYLPEAHNDFIYAIIGEELGLLGTLLVLCLFGVLAFGMFRIVRRHKDNCARITTTAIATWILCQAMVNIGVVIGLVPVIGVPLPLVSAGGSAMISTLIAIGVVLAFARTEPGAAAALAARRGVVARSLAVVGSRVRRG
ncbi:MAG: peptidoglycan glycosyltransferase FtsW [Georgenia sp.]